MTFDRRKTHRLQGVAHGHTRMSIRRRIDHDSIGPVEKRFPDAVHQGAFAVALGKIHFDPELFRHLPEARFDLRKRNRSVDFHLPAAEKIQVRSIDN